MSNMRSLTLIPRQHLKTGDFQILKSLFLIYWKKIRRAGDSGPKFPKGNNQLGPIYPITPGLNHLFTLIMSTGLESRFGLLCSAAQAAFGWSASQIGEAGF